jgi:uncharacterized protein
MLKMSHDGKLKDLKDRIREKERLLISYSGGVDSSLLAKLAHDVLGEGAVAVILDSEIYPRSELEEAVALAESLGLELRVERFSILDDQAFSQNPSTRCYICKKRSSAILKRVAQKEGMSCIADGVNADDLDDYRPGIHLSIRGSLKRIFAPWLRIWDCPSGTSPLPPVWPRAFPIMRGSHGKAYEWWKRGRNI